jgi:hypothetical protein
MERIALMLVMIGLVACAPDKPPEKTVFDPQVEALKKARQVEAQIQKKDEDQRRAMDEAAEAKQIKGY